MRWVDPFGLTEQPPALSRAVARQLARATSLRRAYNSEDIKGYYKTLYGRRDLGGFIFEGEAWFPGGRRENFQGYLLDTINIRAAEGLVAEPGLFDGCLYCMQEGATALVIAASTDRSLDDLLNEYCDYYMTLAERLGAPVYVIAGGAAVVKFEGGFYEVQRK